MPDQESNVSNILLKISHDLLLLSSQTQVKEEPEDMFGDNFGENETKAEVTNFGQTNSEELNQELKTEVKKETVKYANFVQAKQENVEESAIEGELNYQ